MKLLIAPWVSLLESEKPTALEAARILARTTMRALPMAQGMRRENPFAHTLEAARPAHYAHHAIMMAHAQPLHAAYWRHISVDALVEDPRVCVFAATWEEERLQRLGLPQPTRHAGLRERAMRSAAEAWTLARRRHQEARDRLEAAPGTPLEDPLRLAVGRAYVAKSQAEDNYWRAVMLSQAATYDRKGP